MIIFIIYLCLLEKQRQREKVSSHPLVDSMEPRTRPGSPNLVAGTQLREPSPTLGESWHGKQDLNSTPGPQIWTRAAQVVA